MTPVIFLNVLSNSHNKGRFLDIITHKKTIHDYLLVMSIIFLFTFFFLSNSQFSIQDLLYLNKFICHIKMYKWASMIIQFFPLLRQSTSSCGYVE